MRPRLALLLLATAALLAGCAEDTPPSIDEPSPVRDTELLVDEFTTVVESRLSVQGEQVGDPVVVATDIYRAIESREALLEVQPCDGMDGVPVNHLQVFGLNAGDQPIAEAVSNEAGLLVGAIEVDRWVGSLGLVFFAEGEPVAVVNDCEVTVRVSQVVNGELPDGYTAFT